VPVEYRDHIRRTDAQAEPGTLFLFGDNLARRGYGGQARELRGEPNAVGIPTKRSPYEYLNDADLPTVREACEPALQRIANHLNTGGLVVVPFAVIGTGRADLARQAPAVHRYIQAIMVRLHEQQFSP